MFADLEKEFIPKLQEVLSNLFDPEVAFVQRDHDMKCSYCDFAHICNRVSIDS